jgi:hypothetical protein
LICVGANGAFRRFGGVLIFSFSSDTDVVSTNETTGDVRPVDPETSVEYIGRFSSFVFNIKRLFELLLSSRERCRVNRNDFRI